MPLVVPSPVLSSQESIFSDDFNRVDGPLSTPWSIVDYNSSTPVAGILGNRLSIRASGDMWGSSDRGTLVYKVPNFVNFRIACTTLSAGAYARHLMIRKSLAANSAMVATVRNGANNGVTLVWRNSDGAVAAWTGGSPNAPYIGEQHSLVYQAGIVQLLNSAGAVVTSRAISWTPGLVGICNASSSGLQTAVYDDYFEYKI